MSSISRAGDPGVAEQFVDGDPAGDGGLAADLVLGVVEDLAQQPHPVRRAAAVLVGAGVVAGGQEVLDAAEGVAGVHVDEVIAGRSDRRTASRCQRRRSAISDLVMARACTGS